MRAHHSTLNGRAFLAQASSPSNGLAGIQSMCQEEQGCKSCHHTCLLPYNDMGMTITLRYLYSNTHTKHVGYHTSNHFLPHRTYMCIRVHVYMYIHVHVHTRTCIYVHTCTCRNIACLAPPDMFFCFMYMYNVHVMGQVGESPLLEIFMSWYVTVVSKNAMYFHTYCFKNSVHVHALIF